jgi:Transposase zinc-binding domain/Putative transposase
LARPFELSVCLRSRLREILLLGRDHWDHDNYDPDSRRAFSLAVKCKTAAMGGRIFASENEERVFYNSCKSPACPSCGHWATIQWQRERWCAIPDGPYLEITLTMPDTLWGLFARNAQLCRKLPEIAARVIRSYARVRHGVEVGVMPVLHTFNGELRFKPHVHSLVTAGGLQPTGSRWNPWIFFDRDALMRSWQRLIIVLLRETSETGQLEFEVTRDEIEGLLQFEETRRWIAPCAALQGKGALSAVLRTIC